jgi:hypothetical protein
MGEIAIATARGGVARDRSAGQMKGIFFTGYPNEKWWRFRAEHVPDDLPGLARFLADRVDDTASCCLYGQLISPSMDYQRRLIHPAVDSQATLREIPRDHLILD